MELSERKLRILRAIIDEYILSGVPVGSRSLSKREDLAFSAATIRNEMADLEELGYLEKEHASSGRRPNERAYRLYVDSMMEVNALSEMDVERIRSILDQRANDMSEVLDAAARALSELTAHIGLVTAPGSEEACLRRIQIVKVSDIRALAVFVTDTGIVRDILIEIPPLTSGKELEYLSSELSRELHNVPVSQAEPLIRAMSANVVDRQKPVMQAVLEAINKSRSSTDMHLGGQRNIWKYPEYQNIEKAGRFLELLEAKDWLRSLLAEGQDLEFSIRIGSEMGDPELQDLSVVTAAYRAGRNHMGSFGIIGPTRMDYARVLSVLKCVGMSLSDILSGFAESKDD